MHYIPAKGLVIALITLGGITIDEHTGIPIGIAASVAVAWGSAIWFLGRKLQSLEDGQKQAVKDRAEVYAQLGRDRDEFKKVIDQILARLDALPCNADDCHDKRKHR